MPPTHAALDAAMEALGPKVHEPLFLGRGNIMMAMPCRNQPDGP